MAARRMLVPLAAAAAAIALATPASARPVAQADLVGTDDSARAALAGMTSDEKLGQLFETYVYGASATSVTPAEAAANQSLYGVSTGAQVIAKYHLGSVIYFTWTDNLGNPTQIANLSNGLQQATADDSDAPL